MREWDINYGHGGFSLETNIVPFHVSLLRRFTLFVARKTPHWKITKEGYTLEDVIQDFVANPVLNWCWDRTNNAYAELNVEQTRALYAIFPEMFEGYEQELEAVLGEEKFCFKHYKKMTTIGSGHSYCSGCEEEKIDSKT